MTSRATVELLINGEKAKKTMEELTQKVADFKKKSHEAALEGNGKNARKFQLEAEKAERQLKRLQDQVTRTENTLLHMDKASLSDLNAALRQVQGKLKGIERGTATWNEHAELVRRLRGEIARCNDAMRAQETRTSGFLAWFNRWQTAATAGMGIIMAYLTRLYTFSGKAEEKFASMEQEMANVRKFSGMDAEGVEQLNDELKKIDTRTSREDLNKLAQEAGRLGKTSQEDVLGFVRAADKINVALDDLGEGATLTLSKLTGIFGDEKRLGTERALLSVGSVINELSQNCSASAPYIAEFASRMGGVGVQAGMTVQQIMAYAAVLNTNNLNLEASATALQQVIVRIYQEPQKYAKVAGLDATRFAKLVKTDMNAALLEFLTTLSKAGSMDVLSPMFKDMGENGSGAISALSTLAGHIEDVTSQQEVANRAFAEATSIDKEFAVQNNTVQAGLEKSNKRIGELVVKLGKQLHPVMCLVRSSSEAAMKALSDTVAFIAEHRVAILSAVAAWTAYRIAVGLAAAETRIMAALEKGYLVIHKTLTAAMTAGHAALLLVTGQAKRAAEAFRTLNASMSSNVWGAVVALIGLAIGSLIRYVSKLNDTRAKEAQMRRERADAYRESINYEKEAIQSYGKEISSLKSLYAAATDEALAKDRRLDAAKRLMTAYPEMLGNFNAEQIMLGNAKSAYDKLTESIISNARARAAAKKIEENEEKLLELEADLDKHRKTYSDSDSERKKILESNRQKNVRAANLAGSFTGAIAMGAGATQALHDNLESTAALEQSIRESAAEIRKDKTAIHDLRKANQTLAEKFKNSKVFQDERTRLNENHDLDPDSGATGLGSGGYTSQTLAEKERKKAEAAARRAAAKEKKEFRQRLESVKGEWEKEDAANTARYRSGEGTYLEFLERKHDLEIKYLDDSMKVYADADLQEDEDYAALLKKKEERLMKWNERKKSLEASEAQRRQRYEEMEANTDFLTPASQLFGNEEVLQMRLYDIKIKYLKKAQAAQQRDSEEYHNYEVKIQESEQEEKMRRQKRFMEVVQKYSVDFQRKSAEERLAIERECLEQALRLGMITQEQFEKSIKALRDSMLPESQKEPEDKSKSKKHYSNDPSYKSELQNLESLHAAKLISEEEFLKRKAKLEEEYQRKGLKESGDNYVTMLANIWDAFKKLKESQNPGDVLSNLADLMAASWAVAQAAIQSYSEYSQACADLEVAQAEKKYERITAFAEGNAYKTKQAEKQKEKEIARIKSEQSRKQFAMNVLTAVAQTAINAVAAYGAGLQVGGPAGLVLAPIAAAMAVAAGAIQIATLKKQKQAAEATGYMQGGFTPPGRRDKAVGVVHAGEWVAPQELVNNPRTRPMIEFLESARRGNRIGSITHADVSRTVTAPIITAQSSRSAAATAVQRRDPAENSPDTRLGDTLDRLEQRLSKPFVTVNTVTGDHGIRKAEEEYDRLMRNKSK